MPDLDTRLIQPMHVGLFTPSWPYGDVSNGVVTYVHWLRRGLIDRGHRVSVFAFHMATALPTDANAHRIRSARATVLRRRFLRLFGRRQTPDEVIAEDLLDTIMRVHRHAALSVFEMEESFGWFAGVSRRAPFPVVVKLHGPAFLSLVEEELASETARLKIEAEGVALKAAKVITSPSRGTLEDTVRRYGLETPWTSHIPNPLQQPASVPAWSLETRDQNLLVFVGRFDKRKGADRLLAAFKLALSVRPSLALVMIGPDAGLSRPTGEIAQFDAVAQSMFTSSERSSITFLGRLATDEAARFRSRAAAVLVPSRWESQGYTALEAMLQGCPVIGANTSGLGEAIRHGENGLLFDGDDTQDFVDQIFRLVDDAALAQRLGAQARLDVASLHGIDRVVDQTLIAYQAACALQTAVKGSAPPVGSPAPALEALAGADVTPVDMASPTLTIIIVNYNTAHLLGTCLGHVEAATTHLPVQVLIVDNASRDDSVALLRRDFSRYEVIENRHNVGFGRANNQVLEHVRGRYVLLLNTDALVEPDAIAKTIAYMETHPRCGVLGVRLVGANGESQPSCRYFPTPWNKFLVQSGGARIAHRTRLVDDMQWDHESVRQCDWVPGCYYLTRKEVIDQVGLFDPRFFLYFEEVDHCRAVKAAGWEVTFFPYTTVIHLGGESAKSVAPTLGAGNQISALQTESEFLYFRKHHGAIGVWLSLLLSWLAETLLAIRRTIRWRRAGNAAAAWRNMRMSGALFLATRGGRRPTR